MKTYTIGIDFGTLSGRCVLVDCSNGREIAEAVYQYPHGVMDDCLPSGKKLPPLYALQHPEDYLQVVRITVPAVLDKGGISPEQVVGIGIDFTACTILPVNKEGVPLCMLEKYVDTPHAYVKLWKHHAAQPEADELNDLASRRDEEWLKVYGGRVSSEWALPKILQILREAPEIYEETARFMEAADWLVSKLVGKEIHSLPFAGYKGLYHNNAYPSNDFMVALDKGLDGIVGTKLSENIVDFSALAGVLGREGAELTGLPEGIPVATPQIDAHAAMPALQITEAGELMLIMGTSACHIVNAKTTENVKGICGYVQGGVIPGLTTYEAGQAAVGDIFDWFVKNCVPASYENEANDRGISIHKLLREKAKALPAGSGGIIALDWWNGNRTPYVDGTLSGVIVGLTIGTKPEQIYRALIEATAYGTKRIIDIYEASGIEINALYAAGGIAEKDELLMQIYADVTGREIKLSGTAQACAYGSAVLGATNDPEYENDVKLAATKLKKIKNVTYKPNEEDRAKYEKLYAKYVELSEYFAKGGSDVMKIIKN